MKVDHVDQSSKEAIPILVKLNYKCTELTHCSCLQRGRTRSEFPQWNVGVLVARGSSFSDNGITQVCCIYLDFLLTLSEVCTAYPCIEKGQICVQVCACVCTILPFVLLNGPGKACPFCLSESLFSHHRCGHWLTQMCYHRHGALPCLVHVYACAHA